MCKRHDRDRLLGKNASTRLANHDASFSQMVKVDEGRSKRATAHIYDVSDIQRCTLLDLSRFACLLLLFIWGN